MCHINGTATSAAPATISRIHRLPQIAIAADNTTTIAEHSAVSSLEACPTPALKPV
jgi:hypothetical protein